MPGSSRVSTKFGRAARLCTWWAPPGAGKTTLVASWLEARKLAGIWFQTDAGDADPAAFFYYLGEAALPFGRRAPRLPMLTADYRDELMAFFRGFFRTLFARMPRASVLVLDNYQEIEIGEAIHGLLAEAISEVPLGVTLVLIGRRNPPEQYARLLAYEDLCVLDWDDLRLTRDETRAIAAARVAVTDDAVNRLYAQADG